MGLSRLDVLSLSTVHVFIVSSSGTGPEVQIRPHRCAVTVRDSWIRRLYSGMRWYDGWLRSPVFGHAESAALVCSQLAYNTTSGIPQSVGTWRLGSCESDSNHV